MNTFILTNLCQQCDSSLEKFTLIDNKYWLELANAGLVKNRFTRQRKPGDYIN
jgi:hypothetical protein